MALTLEERKIAEELKGKGFNAIEISSFIAGQRTNRNSSIREKILDASKEEQPKGGFVARVKDIPSDLKETFGGAVDAVATGIDRSREIRERVERGETSPVAGTVQTIGAGFGAGVKTVGEGIMGLGKLFTSPKTEQKIGETASELAQGAIESTPAQELIRGFQSLPEETQRNIQAGGEIAEGITTMFGFAPIISKFKNELGPLTRRLLTKSDEVLEKTRQVNRPVGTVGVTPQEVRSTVSSTIKDARFNLSDIDPQVETALKRSNFDDVNRHFQQAKNAAKDPAKATPLELVANRAKEAGDSIQASIANARKGKRAILDKVADQPVPGNIINDTMSSGIQRMQERFGARITAKGEITGAPGRTLQLDSADQRLIGEYFSRLNSLGVAPNARQVDDFIDWAQSQLYKQSQTFEKASVASDPVISELRQVTGQLNDSLKGVVGNGYAEVNARIRGLLTLEDEINRGLGVIKTVDAAGNPLEVSTKGAGFVKRLFSPSGENTRRVFEQIYQETGIDLFKEATLAKFAMESVGDIRQKSLLQRLGIALEETTQIDLTKPTTIIKFIRERADMDAQELANEIIRRANASGQ